MAVDTPRPSTSGSARASRFHEGSMNDRVSTAPPLEFLGPEEIRAYEAQFFGDPAQAAAPRKQRPVSDDSDFSLLQDQQQQPGLIKKKSFRFFARVRDALSWTSRSDDASSSSFSSSSSSSSSRPQADEEDVKRKHSSLPEPCSSSTPPASPKRPHLRQKSQSSVHVPQARGVGSDAASKAGLQHHPSVGNLSDRPTKEEIMQSYNELVASGFFKAHAIQSTRQPPPGSATFRPPHPPSSLHNQPHHPQHQTSAPAHPPLPTIPSVGSGLEQQQENEKQPQEARQTKSQPRHMPSHIALAAMMPSSPKRAPPPQPSPAAAATGPKELQRSKLTGSLKRSRSSTDDGTTSSSRSSSEVQTAARTSSSATTTTPTSPLKRVAKKLRKMPSSIAATTASMTSSAKAATAPNQAAMAAADGMVHLRHQTEKPVRLREPSPAPPEVTPTTMSSPTSKRHSKSSGFLRRSGPGKISPRRCAGGNRLPKRGRPPTPPPPAPQQFRSPSPSRPKAKAGPPVSMPLSLSVSVLAAPTSGPGCVRHGESGEPFMSLDRVPLRDSSLRGGWGGRGRARGGSGEYVAVTTSTADTNIDDIHTTTNNTHTAIETVAWVSPPKAVPRQLSILPDANRGIPSVPRIPDHYYYHQQKQPHGNTELESELVDENRMQVDWQYGQAL
ncbi:hypothetical protein DL764_002935 [Monosporascus ibericus]|uniref:Uncharacterized protein n=1 Tax=Monosporascus ibericus TaxID=155417 RepID=A0A4Q4TNA6_9PEZI|nr:hypothetical protein DL764_002935 [Monosporascus ibericus]